jgi:peroxiredoxin
MKNSKKIGKVSDGNVKTEPDRNNFAHSPTNTPIRRFLKISRPNRYKFHLEIFMKKGILSVLLSTIFAVFSIFAQESAPKFNYSISGSITKNSEVKKVCVGYEIVGEKTNDCANVPESRFSLSKKIIQPTAAIVSTDNAKIKPLKIFLGNTDFIFNIADEINFVSKPSIQSEFEKLIVIDNIRPNYFALYGELGEKNDETGLAKLSELFDSFKQTDVKISYIYFKNNPQSLLSVYAFERFAVFQSDYSLLDEDFRQLPDWIKTSAGGKYIADKIAGAKSVALDKSAPVFSQTAIDGKRVGLENFRGKYVLLDFWASWCVPCRKENPNLAKSYEKYKFRNFEIISVSIDEDKNAWQNASKEDKINWINLLDAKGKTNEIAVKYGVQSVPANFLIDPNGIIIGKNLKIGELEKILSERLK